MINGFKITAAIKMSWSAFAHRFSMLSMIAEHPGILTGSIIMRS